MLFAYSCDGSNGSDDILTVSLTEDTVAWDATSATLEVESNTVWTTAFKVVSPAGGAQWVTSDMRDGSGNKTVGLSFGENQDSEARKTLITVTTGDVTHDVTLTQEGRPASAGSIEISLTVEDAAWDTAYSDLIVKSDMEWKVTIEYLSPEGVSGWITPSLTTWTGDRTVRLTLEDNYDADRSAEITVAGEGAEKKITLTQKGHGGSGEDFPAWTELPAIELASGQVFYTHFAQMGGKEQRNYSVFYDKNIRTAMWVAYPLCKDHTGSLSRPSSWNSDPKISSDDQVLLKSSYGASAPGGTNNIYARGHQIPNGDRNGVRAMQLQTFYYTNSTPQNQNGFNGGVWGSIEELMRGQIPSQDTVWVVTGPVFKIVGGDEEITQIRNSSNYSANDPKGLVDLPNYYFRIGLKKKGDGYTTIAFWLKHQYYTGMKPTNFVTTVRDIEEKTGYDFFANLPQDVQDAIETKENRSDWGL